MCTPKFRRNTKFLTAQACPGGATSDSYFQELSRTFKNFQERCHSCKALRPTRRAEATFVSGASARQAGRRANSLAKAKRSHGVVAVRCCLRRASSTIDDDRQ